MTTPTFGALLTAYRRRAGLSQSKLAERADLDTSYVSRLSTGDRVPSRETVEALATALDLTDAETNQLRQAAGFLPSDPAGLLSCALLARLDDEHRRGSPERKAWIEAWAKLALEVEAA
jgi:transcriptional regulator with XRE-family HTH domain